MIVPVTRNVPKAFTHSSMLFGKCITIALAVTVTLFSAMPLFAQNTIRVKGRVTGEGDVPVSDATISSKIISAGTVSDVNGNYEMESLYKGALVISAIRLVNPEIAVRRRQTIHISLITSGQLPEAGAGIRNFHAFSAKPVRSLNGRSVLPAASWLLNMS